MLSNQDKRSKTKPPKHQEVEDELAEVGQAKDEGRGHAAGHVQGAGQAVVVLHLDPGDLRPGGTEGRRLTLKTTRCLLVQKKKRQVVVRLI